jgi:hypothetical protein
MLRKIIAISLFIMGAVGIIGGCSDKENAGSTIGMGIIFIVIGYFTFPKKDKKERGVKLINKSMEKAELAEHIYKNDRPLPKSNKAIENGIVLPETDNWETDYLIGKEGSIPLDILCFLKYRDGQGQISRRRVTLKSLVPWNDEYALLAYCHERQAHRTFKLSGIQELCDLETGEIIEEPIKYLTDHYNNSPIGLYSKLLSEIETQILVLCFIARADGRMTPPERKIIVEFVNKKSKTKIDENVVESEIKRTYCELADFNSSIKKLVNLNINDAELFLTTVNNLIEVDKKKDPLELAAVEKLKKYLSS